ncbi:MAG: flagellar motor switch protein FliN [Armatimonadota bacterium]
MDEPTTDIESGALPVNSEPSADSAGTSMAPTDNTAVQENAAGLRGDAQHEIEFLGDVQVVMTVELGRASMPVRDVLKLHRGSVVELEKLVGQPADLLVNNTPMAKGEVIVINERFGFRITKFIKPEEN